MKFEETEGVLYCVAVVSFHACMLILPVNCVCVCLMCVFSSPPPKIVFNRMNGKRYHSTTTHKTPDSAEGFTPAHEENVRFVYEGKGHRRGQSRRDQQHDEKTCRICSALLVTGDYLMMFLKSLSVFVCFLKPYLSFLEADLNFLTLYTTFWVTVAG